jgi:hypothetical protein
MRMSLTLFADQELGSHWLAALPLWMYPQLVDQDNDQQTLIKREAEGRNTKTKVTGFKSNTYVCVSSQNSGWTNNIVCTGVPPSL